MREAYLFCRMINATRFIKCRDDSIEHMFCFAHAGRTGIVISYFWYVRSIGGFHYRKGARSSIRAKNSTTRQTFRHGRPMPIRGYLTAVPHLHSLANSAREWALDHLLACMTFHGCIGRTIDHPDSSVRLLKASLSQPMVNAVESVHHKAISVELL